MSKTDPTEKQRVDAVKSYMLINKSAKQDFDQIARVASILCDVPIVLISFVDECTQHFISYLGLDFDNVPSEETFCKVLLDQNLESLIITDTLEDERFAHNKYVKGYPNIRFYAGFPLKNKENYVLGTFCLIDNKPRTLTQKQLEGVDCLANQCLQIFELLKRSYDLDVSRKLYKANSERLTNIIEASNVGTWEWNLKSDEVILNHKLAEILGYELDELQPATAKTIRQKVHQGDLQKIDEKLEDYLTNDTAFYSSEYRIKHKEGHWIWILDRGRVVQRDENNNPLLVFGTHTDITDRKRAAIQFNKSNKRLKVAQNIAKLGYLETNFKSQESFWSDQIYAIWDVEEPERGTFGIEQLKNSIHSEDKEVFKEWFSNEEAVFCDFRIILKDNTLKWIRATKTSDQKKEHVFEGVFQDITSQKALKTSLDESEKRYSNLFQYMPIPSWVYDLETLSIKDVNNAAIESYGFSRAEFLSMTIKDIRPSEEIPRLIDVVKHTKTNINDYKTGIYTHKRKDNSELKVEVHSNQLVRNNELSRVVMSVNISERYKYIAEIEEQNNTLQEIARIQSHIVRAPLAKIMAIIELIKEDDSLNATEHTFFLNELLTAAIEFDKIIRSISDKASQLNYQQA